MEASLSAAGVDDGKLKAIDLGNVRVAVANVGGSFFAFSDSCTHRGCSLSEGALSEFELSCVCHGARFDIRTGEVLGGPARDVLKTYHVSVDDGSIKISG